MAFIVGHLCTFPTHELARQAKTTIRHYTNQIIKACYLDKENPVKEWESILKNVHGIKMVEQSCDQNTSYTVQEY